MDKFVDIFKKRLTDHGIDADRVDAWCVAHQKDLDRALEGVRAIHSPEDVKGVLKRLDDLFVEGAYADLGPQTQAPADLAAADAGDAVDGGNENEDEAE